MAKYEYANDFAADQPDEPAPREPWMEQPLTVPLYAWAELVIEREKLKNDAGQLYKTISDLREQVRHKDNEIARLRGEGAFRGDVESLRRDLEDALAECRRLNGIIDGYRERGGE